MPRIRYRADDLKVIRESPLVKKPDALPAIDQWFEAPAQQSKPSRPGTGRGEEQDSTARRPNLFEHRQRTGHSHSGAGDDFLGPRSSFATLSAARQSKSGHADSEHDILRNRTNRIGDRPRDKEGSRRYDTNGHGDEERSARPSEARRPGGFNKDQPWIREGAASKEPERSWRESRPRKDLPWGDIRNHDSQNETPWAMPSVEEKSKAPTADDMKAFMQKMRAADMADASPQSKSTQTPPPPPPPPNNDTKAEGKGESDGGVMISDNLFGMWGDKMAKAEPKIEIDMSALGKVSSKSAKKSRFFPGSLSADAVPVKPEETPPPVPELRTETPPLIGQQQVPRNPEDVEGFNRIMAMLSMKSNTPKDLLPSVASPPPGVSHRKQSSLEGTLNGKRPEDDTDAALSRNVMTPPNPIADKPLGPPRSNSRPQSHSQVPSRDSEFLMNLMRGSSGPAMSRAPFNETQIYGQAYGRPPPPRDIPHDQMMNNFSSPPPQSHSRGPPPGVFQRNDHAFAANHGLDMPAEPPRRDIHSPEDFRGMPEPPFIRHDSIPPPPGMPGFDEQGSLRRPPGLNGLPTGITPPPGFHSGGRGQSGFMNFPPPMNQSVHQPPPFPGMRPPMQPPGFFNGPPGLGQPGRPGPGQERPPSGQFPGMPPMGGGPPPYMVQGQAMGGPQRR